MAVNKWPEELPAHDLPIKCGVIAPEIRYLVTAENMAEARRRWRAYPKLVEALKEAHEWCEDDAIVASGDIPTHVLNNRAKILSAALREAGEL